MKILKLLNNKSFSILCFFFIFFSQNLSAEDDPVDIWNLEEMPKKEILSDNDKIQEDNTVPPQYAADVRNDKTKKIKLYRLTFPEDKENNKQFLK